MRSEVLMIVKALDWMGLILFFFNESLAYCQV